MSTKTVLANLLRAEIEAAGHRQYEIARTLGISEKHLSETLCGKTGPSLDLIDEILALCARRLVVGTEPITEVPEVTGVDVSAAGSFHYEPSSFETATRREPRCFGADPPRRRPL